MIVLVITKFLLKNSIFRYVTKLRLEELPKNIGEISEEGVKYHSDKLNKGTGVFMLM